MNFFGNAGNTPTAEDPRKILLDRDRSQLVVHWIPQTVREAVARVVENVQHDFVVEPPISMWSKLVPQPRDIQFRSDESKGYFYSGQVAESQPLTDDMRSIMQWANELVGAKFNGILLNRYRNGHKNVGPHSDSESGLDKHAGVLAISHGAVRKFRIRDKKTKQIVLDVPTRSTEAIQMAGDFQKHFKHEIPKETTVHEERVSLTFRRHDIASERRLWAQHMRAVEEKQERQAEMLARQKEMQESLKRKKEETAEERAADMEERNKMKRTWEAAQEKKQKLRRLAIEQEGATSAAQ